ncbi:putative reverse transcriptase domain-containing protein [Tanacetum coccineum]|uniref:Reverse transcriptase domain-containing protein n=1 Tax=Tanacetum coccineum TaxID=301880 RepID=A0ABQ5E7J1_9ASTR
MGIKAMETKFEATNKILRTIRDRIKETLKEITKHQPALKEDAEHMAEYTAYVLKLRMDWMAEHRAEVVCYEKYIRIPYGNNMLIIQGKRSGVKNESRLEVISSIKTQKWNFTSKADTEDELGCNVKLSSCTAENEELGPKQLKELSDKEELYAKFSKCEFWINTIKFLGHVIDSSGIYVDPTKIEVVKNWASPTTPSEIHQFLENRSFDWGEEQEEAFQLLKQKLCVAPILALPEGSEDFMVYCDASIKGLGAILVQRMKVIAYASRQLKIHEKNYTTHDLDANGLELLSDYKCEIRYPPGKENCCSSALSRKERIERCEMEVGDDKTMDFVTNYPNQAAGYDSIWVIIDRLTKSAHFLPMRETDSTEKLMRLYMKEIVARHGISVSIISDRDSHFTSRSERTIQTLEDMLRAYAIDFRNGWDRHLPLVEFSYNNSYHTSIKAAPFEALYGRKCRSPVCWVEVREAQLIGPEIIHETTKKIFKIRDRMQAARDRQKSYADKRRRPLEFEVGDNVILKVAP